jgi:cytochrome c oxidase assembly factor CtaG
MLITAALVVIGAGYLVGVRRSAGRYPSLRKGIRVIGPLRVVAFLAGLAAVAAALSARVHESAETRFWAHMGQHMILIVVAAPLLATGGPAVPFLLLLPRAARRRVSRWRAWLRMAPGFRLLYRPAAGWLASICALWFWHIPGAYDLALHSDLIHSLEHAVLLLAFWAFWWHVLRADGEQLSGGVAVLYVFAAMLPASALGAVLTFARSPLYPAQAAAAIEAGRDPLADQQVAGLIMWIPADLLYLVIAVVLFLRWFVPLVAATEEIVTDPDQRVAALPAAGTEKQP